MTDLVFEEQFDGGFLSSRWKTLAATYGQPTRRQTYRSGQIIIGTDGSADDGNICTLRAERKSPVPTNEYKWWSGGFDSGGAGKFYPAFGRYELRGKLSHGQGLWPAFWMTHRNGGSTAEIDVMEYFHSAEPGETRATVWLDYNAATGYSLKRGEGTGSFETPTLTPDWHVWAVDIEPLDADDEVIVGDPTAETLAKVRFTFYVDDVQIWQWVESTRLDWILDHLDHLDDLWNIKVNLQIDGSYVGGPDDTLGYYAQVDKCANNNSAPPGGDPTACTLLPHIRRAGFNDVGALSLPSLRTGQAANFAAGNADFVIDYIRVYAQEATAPAEPVIAVTETTTSTVTIGWPTPASGGTPITGYVMYRAPHGAPLVAVETTGPTGAYAFTGLDPETEYDFAVDAVNAVGSTRSNTVTETTASPGDPPDAPVIAASTITALTARVTWEPPIDNGSTITGYRLYRALTGDTLELVATIGFAAAAYTFTGLDPDTTYDLAIEAVNAAGASPMSDPVTVTTLAGAFVPTAPTITHLAPAYDAITVHWSPSLPNGSAITGYSVYGAPHGDTLTLLDTVDADVLTYEAAVGTPGAQWDFQVSAVNGVGESTRSAVSSTSTTAGPSTPTLVVTGAATTSLTVRWAAPASGGSPITGYRLYIAPSGDPLTLDATVAAGVTIHTFTGLDPDTDYDLAVAAVNADAASDTSTPVTRSTLALPGDVGAATFTPFPGMPTRPPRYMRARLWDQTMSTFIADLPWAEKNHVEVTVDGVGGGSLTHHKDRAGATELVGGRIVQVQLWDTGVQAYRNAYLWRIADAPKVEIAKTIGERVMTPAGRGVEQDFDTSHVDPHYGPGHIPWGDIRNFGWQAPELLDNGTGPWPWSTPNVRLSQGNPDAHPPYGLYGKPYGYPNPLSTNLWGQAPVNGADPAGFSYFRYRFTLNRDIDVTFYVTADDLFVLALDGVDIVEWQTDGAANASGATYWRKLHLAAGDHVVAARVENLNRPGISENCGLFNMCATYAVTPWQTSPWETTDTQEFLFTTAGWSADYYDATVGAPHPQGWRSLAYPERAPGMSPGSILRILIIEAQARGELPGWTVTFTDLLDSAGNAWPEYVSEFAVRVGTTYTEVLKQLVDQGYIHWAVSADNLTLHVWAANHDFGVAPGATYTEGTNIASLSSGDKWGLARDKALARTENGWVRRGTGPRGMTLSVPDMSDAAKIDGYLDQQIARTQNDASHVEGSFIPTSPACTPLLGYRPLQAITIPGDRTPQVTQCTLDENPVGPPSCSIQLQSLIQSANQRISEVQDRTAPGAFNGRAVSIAPYTKSQPQGGELKMVEVSYNLGARASNAATNAISDGLTYADSADQRPTARWKIQMVELTASEPQIDEPAYTGYSVVQVLYNGHVGMNLGLGPGQLKIRDFFGSSYVDPRFAWFAPFPNWFLETGPTDNVRVQLVAAGTHRNLKLTLWGYEVP